MYSIPSLFNILKEKKTTILEITTNAWEKIQRPLNIGRLFKEKAIEIRKTIIKPFPPVDLT